MLTSIPASRTWYLLTLSLVFISRTPSSPLASTSAYQVQYYHRKRQTSAYQVIKKQEQAKTHQRPDQLTCITKKKKTFWLCRITTNPGTWCTYSRRLAAAPARLRTQWPRLQQKSFTKTRTQQSSLAFAAFIFFGLQPPRQQTTLLQ